MSAEYTSNKPDGYMVQRNEIYRHREMEQQRRTFEAARDAKVLPEQNKANYGFGKIKY